MAIDKRLIFYEGKHVALKTLDERDILESGWVGWFNNESLCWNNQHHYFPNSFSLQKKFLQDLDDDKGKIQLGVVKKNPEYSSEICGVISLGNIDYIHRNAEIGGILSVDVTRDSPGIFLEACTIMLHHAFEQLGMIKIHGGTFHPFVVQSLKWAFNFEEEGVRKRHVFKNGKFHDVALVSVFSDTVKYPEL